MHETVAMSKKQSPPPTNSMERVGGGQGVGQVRLVQQPPASQTVKNAPMSLPSTPPS
jgi:hypothetical protein